MLAAVAAFFKMFMPCAHRGVVLRTQTKSKHWECLDCTRTWPYTVTANSSMLAQNMDMMQNLEREQRAPKEVSAEKLASLKKKNRREAGRQKRLKKLLETQCQ